MKTKEFFQDLQDLMDKYSIPGFTETQSSVNRVWVELDEIEIDDYAHDWDREYRECFKEAVAWAITRFKELNK